MPIRTALGLVLLLMLQPPADTARDALNLGRTHDDALFDSFNRGYGLSVSGTIESAEIITEFRRAVLVVREHATQGDYVFDAQDLAGAMAPYKGLVTFIVQARLHPLNTFVKAPPYELYVSTGPSTDPVAARSMKRDPVYPVGAGPGSSMIGVRIEASFPIAPIAGAAKPTLILTDEHAEILWQTRLDLSRYR